MYTPIAQASEVARLVQEALSLLIALGGILLAVGIALNLVVQQAHLLAGRATDVQHAWARILGLVVGVLLIVLATPIAQVVVDALAGL